MKHVPLLIDVFYIWIICIILLYTLFLFIYTQFPLNCIFAILSLPNYHHWKITTWLLSLFSSKVLLTGKHFARPGPPSTLCGAISMGFAHWLFTPRIPSSSLDLRIILSNYGTFRKRSQLRSKFLLENISCRFITVFIITWFIATIYGRGGYVPGKTIILNLCVALNLPKAFVTLLKPYCFVHQDSHNSHEICDFI